MEQRGVPTSGGGEGGWKPGARAGFRSRLGPEPACFLTRNRRRGAKASTRSHSAGRYGAARGAAQGSSPRPHSHPRSHSFATPPEVPPAPARPFPIGPGTGYRRGLAALWRDPQATTVRHRRVPARDPPRRRVERGRRGQRGGAERAGAAGGTSAPGPGSGRAAPGGSCSSAVVGGGPRLMRGAPRLVSHL